MKITIDLTKDGNAWVACIGPNLQEGVSAHGHSPAAALRSLGRVLSVATAGELTSALPEFQHITRSAYTTRSGMLTIREAGNGFYVSLNGHPNYRRPTAGCGDGTGSWILPEDAGLPEEEFKIRMWNRIIADIEGTEAQWLEAYFGIRS